MKFFFAMKQLFCLWLALLVTVGWAGVAVSREHEKVTWTLDDDGRAFTFSVPGVMAFRGSFSATCVRGKQARELLSTMDMIVAPAGQTQELYSAAGKLLSPPEQTTEETPFGRASVTEVTLRFPKEQIDLLFRASQVPGVRGFQAKAGIRNTGFAPVRLLSLTPVVLEGRVECKPTEWLVTALSQSVKSGPVVVTLDEAQAPFKVFEYGGFYRVDGKGFLFGPVGSPTAYLEASIAYKGDGKMAFSIVSEMSGVLVKPGETRWGQQAGVFAESPRTALPRWAAWVAKTHGARTDKGALSGWNSWQFHGENVTGKDVLAEVDVVVKNPERLRPEVMQIDAGYLDLKGGFTWESNENFSEGMPFYAQRIAVTGARPGIILNFSWLPRWTNMAERIQWASQGGYTYLKINRSELNLLPEEFVNQTSFEVMRNVFKLLRQTAGEGTYLLFNDGHPERASVGLVDANRTGLTASRRHVRRAMTDVLRSYSLNSRWFAVDNDAYYMGTDIANVSEIAGGWPIVRTWMSMVGLSCGAAFTADPWHWESLQPFWRNVEVMTPPAREETVVLDLCTARNWPRLVGHVKRAWGDQTVALLWNPGTTERIVGFDFARAGMTPNHRYAVWSFWDNRYLGTAKGSWKTLALAPSASQHLCFTDLDRTPDKPVLIGSSLHIYCGAAEIKGIKQSRGSMEIELTDAGAREGALFIYSRRQPVWKGAEGCEVAEIASAGENVWRINLVNRQCGAPQRIILGILLPITRQIWFWALIGLVVLSLLFAAWRYVAALRFQRVYALEKERSRIARDMHDDVGSSLTKIGKLAAKLDDPAIAETAREVVQAMDEIVWTVNPRNDTLESLADYLVHYTEDFLRPTGIAYELDVALALPDVLLSAEVRHNVYMAVREALNNAVKHAAPTRIWLGLSVEGDQLTLIVRDDGCGFSQEGLATSSDGLGNMRQRLADIGGELSIVSIPDHGTTLTLHVRLKGIK